MVVERPGNRPFDHAEVFGLVDDSNKETPAISSKFEFLLFENEFTHCHIVEAGDSVTNLQRTGIP